MSDEVDVVLKALEMFEERQAAKAAAEAEKERAAEALSKKIRDEARAEIEAELKTWKDQKGEVHVPKVAKLGSGGVEGDNEAFEYWMRTGDNIAARRSLQEEEGELGIPTDEASKALQEGTGSEGGFLVPGDFYAGIIGLRNEYSWPRLAGVRVFPTNQNVIDIPTVSTQVPDFTRTAEEAAFASDDPAFAQNQVTVHKWTTSVTMANELLEDDQTGELESWYARDVARAMASTEARYCAVGTGTNQHTGVFTGGDTDALTFNTDNGADSDGNLLADAFTRLYFTLGQGYREDAVWLADGLTVRDMLTLRHTQANPNWAFAAADVAEWRGSDLYLLGKRVFQNDNIDVKAANVCFVMFGSPSYYALVERRGLVVMRNPYLRAANGQTVFHNSFRQGGTVLVEAAWVGGVGA